MSRTIVKQREDIQRVSIADINLAIFRRTGREGDVLHAINRVGNRRCQDTGAGLKFPKQLPCFPRQMP